LVEEQEALDKILRAPLWSPRERRERREDCGGVDKGLKPPCLARRKRREDEAESGIQIDVG